MKKIKFKKRYILYIVGVVVFGKIFLTNVSFTDYVMFETGEKLTGEEYEYVLPLDSKSPWPKFRCNALQNGRSAVVPQKSGRRPWVYKTGKGIFSSPVVDENGTVYIGSADHNFYSIDVNGNLKWKYLTGEIIDSSALLDDRGMVYFGSGDGFVYALDRKKGELKWKFQAHNVEEVKEEFDIETYNLNWFEGNIGILKDGTLLAPNDNYLVYAVDRDSGKRKRQYFGNEMIWSLPAVNPETGRIFFGTCFAALKNVFAYDAESGKELWTQGGLGSNAATIMLTSSNENGAAVVGGFDGILRAYAQDDGFEIWKFGARDHIYSSPAQLSDGKIIQASADGTVYALNPETGEQVWAYDTLEPIRSSPAVDGQDNIYIGSGEGRLFCIDKSGELKWAYRCISEDRNDLNSSPALGKEGVYIAGENGGIFYIPYDYPLSEAGKKDPRCTQGPGEDLPSDGNLLVYTTEFGALKLKTPESINANDSITLTLFVRKNGDTYHSKIDKDNISVIVKNNSPLVKVSADGKFVTIIPQEKWIPDENGNIDIKISGAIIQKMKRFGLVFWGGNDDTEYEKNFIFKINNQKKSKIPYSIPTKAGDLATMFELSRLAAPNPTLLPSWNQIGFDSLHYIFGILEDNGKNIIVWGVGGKLDGKDKKTVIDPSLQVRFPLNLNYESGLFTLSNYNGFLLDFNGSWDMPYAMYRLASEVDPISGEFVKPAALNATANGDDIEFYGPFLKLTGMTEISTGKMHIYGGCNFNVYNKNFQPNIANAGSAAFTVSENSVVVEISEGKFKKQDHVFSIVVVDVEKGEVVPLDYAGKTVVKADDNDNVVSVSVNFEEELPSKIRLYYVVDTYPYSKKELTL